MPGPSFEEMEQKRQQMIASFREIANAMTRCVQIIEDYTRLAPGSISAPTESALSNIDPSLVNLPSTLSAFASGPLPALAAAPVEQAQPEEKEKKKAKREKKIKDPNAPKRPPSAYLLFQNDVREKIRQENPGMTYRDILAIISEQWKTLPDAAKKDYETAYQLAQSTFKQNEDAYKAGKIIDAIPVAAEPEESSDTDSDDSDDSAPAPARAPTFGNGAITPALLNAAVNSTPVAAEKEKKRKAKDAAAPATPAVVETEKKKKKKKDAA